MADDPLIAVLASIVGDAHVLVDPELRERYERDFTGRYGGSSRAVVRPGDEGEVAQVLGACAAAGAKVVPQGGNTGVVGGGVPRGDEIVVSTSRLNEIGTVDEHTGQLHVGAGVTLADVQQAASRAGWEMPLDFGARDGATIGGLVATDAGGAKALAHGTMRERVAGLSVVLPDGRVVKRLGGLLKDNAGYSWPSVLVGSEGTLGVITSVLVKLVPERRCRVAALFAVKDAADAMRLLLLLRQTVPSLEAADVFFDEGVALVDRTMDNVRLALGQRSPCYVIVECAAAEDPTMELADAASAAEELIVAQAAADDSAGRRQLWAMREALPEALVRAGVPVKIDVAVPLRQVVRFVAEVGHAIADVATGAEVILWGHLGDGNIHVNVLHAVEQAAAVEARVLTLAASLGGTVSAEHGVGVAKAQHLQLVRSPEEIELLYALKDAFDPDGVMNPGVVLPAQTEGLE